MNGLLLTKTNQNIMSSNKTYHHDLQSAIRKATSGISATICTPTPIISVCKTIDVTNQHNPLKDAYHNCSICKRHYNTHINGKCKL